MGRCGGNQYNESMIGKEPSCAAFAKAQTGCTAKKRNRQKAPAAKQSPSKKASVISSGSGNLPRCGWRGVGALWVGRISRATPLQLALEGF
eukprot:6492343-Amphidinium_carterae.5